MSKKKLDLKEIQKIELDILIYLDKVCKKNNIKYYLSSGTLLGAVKYKGFIPWDDDIDVILMRDEYLRLMDILKNNNEGFVFDKEAFSKKIVEVVEESHNLNK